MRARALVLAFLAPWLPAVGCVEFNQCEEDRLARLGTVALDLDVRESVVRTQETPIGDLVADGLFAVADTLCQEGLAPCPDFAIQNAGGLRQETACGSRDAIEVGPLYERDIKDLMPFENQLLVVTLTGADVKRVLERAVSALGQAGQGGRSGSFLQVSGISFEVDCALPPQALAPDQSAIASEGSRVVSAVLSSRGRDEEIVPDAEYRVAVNSFIAGGNDGFLSFYFLDEQLRVLTDGNGNPVRRANSDTDVVKNRQGQPVSDRLAVMDWVRAHDDAGLAVGRPPEGRITSLGCFGQELE
jgi:2',3'-cyclic-nucleotide 2'-phosphodiesterase (5'-nucleotidase family)